MAGQLRLVGPRGLKEAHATCVPPARTTAKKGKMPKAPRTGSGKPGPPVGLFGLGQAVLAALLDVQPETLIHCYGIDIDNPDACDFDKAVAAYYQRALREGVIS